jgi:hypothetical protein
MEPSHTLPAREPWGRSAAEVIEPTTLVMGSLVPGYLQWTWGQHERALVLGGTFGSAAVVGLFAWGSTLGVGCLGLAYAAHAYAVVDAAWQHRFPYLPRALVFGLVLGTLGCCLYLPLVGLLTIHAWPTLPGSGSRSGYLVDRSAYLTVGPRTGHWIWLRSSPARTQAPRAGRVVATAGQELEWSGRLWRVDGRPIPVSSPGTFPTFQEPWRFRVPLRHVLIDPDHDLRPAEFASSLVIVREEQIVGRAWARFYPIWDRGLL